jgi:hypothetical protein
MQPHRNAPSSRGRATQLLGAVWLHRRRLAAAVAFAVTAATLAVASPVLLTLALLERHQTRRHKNLLGLIVLIALGHAVLWLWRETGRHPLEPRGPWHPCRQCGFPISDRSRARFCSPLCRRLGRLQTRAGSGDERATTRLAWLAREDKRDPAWGEVPF